MSTKHSGLTLLTFVMIMAASRVVSKSSKNVCTGKSGGFQADPENCSGYYMCIAGYAFSSTCEHGKHFNSKIQKCDSPENVGCAKKGRKWRPISATACRKLVCYYHYWASYRNGAGKFVPEDFDKYMCTHIVVSYVTLRGNSLVLEHQSKSFHDKTDYYSKLIALKDKTPDLKVLLMVSGGDLGSAPFREMVTNSNTRKEFIDNSIAYLRDRGFDGLDLYWIYPTGYKTKFSNLITEMKAAFIKEGRKTGRPRLLLTAGVAPFEPTINSAYDVPVLSSKLDHINLIGFDFTGPWGSTTGHHSPLSRVKEAAEYFVKKGAKKEKLFISLPFFGRSFSLASASNHGLYAPAVGRGTAGAYSKVDGYLTYYEVCQLIKNGGTTTFDKAMMVSYAFHKDQWVGYESPRSLKLKLDYIIEYGFGGVWVKSVSDDDRTGDLCGEGRYPLMYTIHQTCHARPMVQISRG